jgi:hypothetical protein
VTAAETWPGCHGVRLVGEPVDLGTSAGSPLAEATIRFGAVAVGDSDHLWTQHGEAVVDGEHFEVDRVMRQRGRGAYVLTGSGGPTMEVDQDAATITIEDGDEAVQLQLLATFGVPLILHTTDALVLHGSACALGDRTIVVCGESGSGKSTLLVGLADAGWTPITEDLCAVDFRPQTPHVWSGPPWVRIGHGKPGPVGSAQRFGSAYKTGWDIAASQTPVPRPITHVVLLDAPGGGDALLEPVPAAVAIRRLAPHGVWLGDQDELGRRLFGPIADLVAKVPAFRLRMPRSDSWLDEVPGLLAARL